MANSNTLSRLFGKFARHAFPTPVQKVINLVYVRLFNIDLTGFAPLESYPTLNALFTRALQTPRPLNSDPKILNAPSDSMITACGRVEHQQALQIKGMAYSVYELLGLEQPLEDHYHFFNFYLSPKDYHRFHAPCNLKILEARHFCGELLSVGQRTLKKRPNVFVRNERVVLIAQDDRGFLLYFVAVGALNVGQIVLNFDPNIQTNAKIHPKPQIYRYDPPIVLEKGTELGRFEMGSSIVLFVAHSTPLPLVGQKVLYGTNIATLDWG